MRVRPLKRRRAEAELPPGEVLVPVLVEVLEGRLRRGAHVGAQARLELGDVQRAVVLVRRHRRRFRGRRRRLRGRRRRLRGRRRRPLRSRRLWRRRRGLGRGRCRLGLRLGDQLSCLVPIVRGGRCGELHGRHKHIVVLVEPLENVLFLLGGELGVEACDALDELLEVQEAVVISVEGLEGGGARVAAGRLQSVLEVLQRDRGVLVGMEVLPCQHPRHANDVEQGHHEEPDEDRERGGG
mmetsp:Transcript_35702/g.102950  ORF Transcript_35702/g.102950 Transcript_35702/m.102950 type:complete len:239 (+) Transcript_35702:4724-5440(+)